MSTGVLGVLGGLPPPEFCFPTSLLVWVFEFHAGSFPLISVTLYYVLSSEDEDLSTKLLGSYVLGWGLLAENFTKVAIWGAILFC